MSNQATADQAYFHLDQMCRQAERQTRRPRQMLCFLVANNMRHLFSQIADDLWGMKIYSHPLLEEGSVQVAPGRFSFGDKAVDRLWTELREVNLKKL